MAEDETFLAVITLNARLQPFDRFELFETGLSEFLVAEKLGDVSGGGALVGDEGEIESCEIDLFLNDDSPDTQNRIIAFLNAKGAPKGSVARFPSREAAHSFGRLEALALYLDGENLADEVYAEADLDQTLANAIAAIGAGLIFSSYWPGPRETALYFYGESFDAMAEALASVVAADPLCTGARIVQIA